jgi:truncated hemoglobin YjbI
MDKGGFQDSMATKIDKIPTFSKTFPEFYHLIGGDAFFVRLANHFYELVAEDDLLSPLFPRADWSRQSRALSGHLRRLWGKDDRTEAWSPSLHAAHSHRLITQEQRWRWLELIGEAAKDAGAPRDQLEEFVAFMGIGSAEIMAVSRGAAIARGDAFTADGHGASIGEQQGDVRSG